MKSNDIRNMTEAEIEQTLESLKEQLFKVRQETQTGQVERPHRFRQLRKDIAKCLTILKERESGKN